MLTYIETNINFQLLAAIRARVNILYMYTIGFPNIGACFPDVYRLDVLRGLVKLDLVAVHDVGLDETTYKPITSSYYPRIRKAN